jgi:DNA-binding transcriptional ArsR family regulator
MNGKNLSSEALAMVADRFKILSEPLRLQILQTLQNGEKSVTELTEAVQTSQPNVSKHLKLLQGAGLVRRQQNGNTVYYSIADESIFTLCELVCNSLEERLKTQASIFTPGV